MDVHANLQLGTMKMTMINCHFTLQLDPFHTVSTPILTLLVENFNEYAERIRRALKITPRGKLTSKELREKAGLPPNTLLPVTKKMEEDGDLERTIDYSTQPYGHIYSLTPKGKAKL